MLFASFVGRDGNAMTGADVLSQWQVDVATFSPCHASRQGAFASWHAYGPECNHASHDTGILAVCSAIVLGVACSTIFSVQARV